MGHTGPRSSWDLTTIGVDNPRIDDPDNLNWDSPGLGNTVPFVESPAKWPAQY